MTYVDRQTDKQRDSEKEEKKSERKRKRETFKGLEGKLDYSFMDVDREGKLRRGGKQEENRRKTGGNK